MKAQWYLTASASCFKIELRLVCADFHSSPCLHLGFTLSPKSMLVGSLAMLNSPLAWMSVRMSGTGTPFRVYSHLSTSRLQIHHNPEQDKDVTEDEWMNVCCFMYVECLYTDLPDSCVFVLFGKQRVCDSEKACFWQHHVCLYCAYFLALLYGLFTPHCPCQTLLPLYAGGISTIDVSVK